MNREWTDDLGKLILRLTLGILILLHGISKVADGVGPIREMLRTVGLPEPLVFGVFLGEVVGPLLLILGWYGRAGAGLIVLNMLFALALVHQQELFTFTPQGGWALELQGMFLFTALALVFTGPGRWSVNQR